jgi:hypothetical protein
MPNLHNATISNPFSLTLAWELLSLSKLPPMLVIHLPGNTLKERHHRDSISPIKHVHIDYWAIKQPPRLFC